MNKRVKRCVTRSVAMAAVVVPLLMSVTAGTAVAGPRTGRGCTQIQGGAGVLCVSVSATSPSSIETFGGSFTAGFPVVRPKLVVDLLYADGKVGYHAERSWKNDRTMESITEVVNQSFARDFERVCATLFEAGERVNTACVPVPSS